AEDGIRGRTVTGVQTCALPISAIGLDADAIAREFLERHPDPSEPLPPAPDASPPAGAPSAARSPETRLRLTLADTGTTFSSGRKIGRASCRERVVGGVVSDCLV